SGCGRRSNRTALPFATGIAAWQPGSRGGRAFGEVPGEFLVDSLEHALTESHESGREPAGVLGQGTALVALPAHPGLHEAHAEGLLGLLDASPDMAVALAERGGGGL